MREREKGAQSHGPGPGPVRSRGALGVVSASPPHVLHVFQPEVGGVPRYVASLADGLIASGWRVSVACPAGARVRSSLEAAGVEVLPLEVKRSPDPLEDAWAVRKLARWCREREVSLIHGHSTKAGMLGALASRRAHIPSAYTPHGWSFERLVSPGLRTAYALFERQFSHRYHATILTVSASGKVAGERWRVAPRGRIRVVRTGLPALPSIGRGAARRLLGIDRNTFVAAWVGRVGDQKQPQDLGPIARSLAGKVKIVALCDGIHGTPLAAELHAAGVILPDGDCDPATVYAAADVMLHTSAWEACPLVVLEAMSAELPIVAYDVGGLREQVQAGRTGYLVQPGDVEMMCECVLALVRKPELRLAMGEAGQLRAATQFSYSSMVEQIVEAYAAIMGPRALGKSISTADRILVSSERSGPKLTGVVR